MLTSVMTGVYSVLFCKYTNYSGIILHRNTLDVKKTLNISKAIIY